MVARKEAVRTKDEREQVEEEEEEGGRRRGQKSRKLATTCRPAPQIEYSVGRLNCTVRRFLYLSGGRAGTVFSKPESQKTSQQESSKHSTLQC